VGQIRRILRMDDDNLPHGFWNLHPDAKKRGFGRTYRSPTLWEDMVKTLTNCNMQWKGTVEMNRKLCRVLGHGCAAQSITSVEVGESDGLVCSFPTPRQIANGGPEYLKKHCRTGYRSPWIVELAQKFLVGEMNDLTTQPQPSTNGTVGNNKTAKQNLQKRILALKGFGVFASSNVMQLMGYFDVFPLDTETTRLFREEFGIAKSVSPRNIQDMAKHHYEQYAPYQFLAYWFDLWRNYERRKCDGVMSTRWSVQDCAGL